MRKGFFLPVVFVILMWLVHLFQVISGLDLGTLGIYPRESSSFIGILTSPLIHGNWEHLLSNSLPLLLLGILLFVLYEKIAIWVWLLNYLCTGILVWMFARSSYHIGASGLVYGLASFLFFSGFFRMDIKSIAIATGVGIFYGGLVWGVLPIQPGVSWESHLLGGIVGLILAYLFRNFHKDEVILRHESERKDRRTFDDFLNNTD